MTEYWKSQARKYCDFCKCWLSDNKVSISFHENGKRHKENVQKHISQLSKKSAKDFKKKEKMDSEIKKMEDAAMAAYLKDVQNNADLTSQSINGMLNRDTSVPSISMPAPQVKAPPVWQEVKNDDTTSYFWNRETNETTWDTPDDYLSLAQQEEQKLKKKNEEKSKKNLKKQQQKEAMEEVRALMEREKMKEFAVKKEEKMEIPAPTSFGPVMKAPNPYGSWKAVVSAPSENKDLQLPNVQKAPPPPVIVEPETIQFKERKVDSLGEGHVDFKKRKLNSNFKRNMRQKTEDD